MGFKVLTGVALFTSVLIILRMVAAKLLLVKSKEIGVIAKGLLALLGISIKGVNGTVVEVVVGCSHWQLPAFKQVVPVPVAVHVGWLLASQPHLKLLLTATGVLGFMNFGQTNL